MGNLISWINDNVPTSTGEEGEAQGTQPQSLSGMVSTLVPVLLISLVYVVIFLFFRKSARRFYAPRTYLGSVRENERSPELPNGLFNWFGTFWKIPDTYALQHQSLDAYLFLRFLRICTTILFVSLCITWPVLFPVNATGGNGKTQLELLGYANINISKSPNRLYAHTFVAWAVYGFMMYMITRECIFFINIRQAYLLAPQYAKRISSRTVIFTAVPDDFLDAARLRQVFSNDAVKNIWIAGETDKVDELVKKRDEAAMKLEKGEIKLLKLVNKERIKAAKKSGEAIDASRDAESANIAARWIPDKKRPSHRLGPLGLLGRKVDTITWAREELHKLIPQTETAQAEFLAGNYKKHSAVFVEFYHQSDAQAAFQVVTHHHALHMSPRFIGVRPQEVIWKNLPIPWWQRIIRRYVAYFAIAVLIIFWAVPVAIVGVVSQVSFLKGIPGLTWLGDIPPVILGVVSGLLPAVAMAILMSLVPVFMRMLARFAGEVSASRVELFTQNTYFVFQVVQVFLVQMLSSSFVSVVTEVASDPSRIFTVLAEAVPTSSNFYVAYFIVQGLTIATGVITQVVGCVIFTLLYRFLANTPRAMYTKWTSLSAISWGSVLPVYTAIVVISIIYAVIAPIMLFWSTLGLALFYLAYRYNVLFVTDTAVDTRGLHYPRALMQLFIGIYIAEVAMVGMFAISKAAGPAALMAVFLIFTLLFHLTLSKSLGPLLYSLPRSLQVQEELYQSTPHTAPGVDLEAETTPPGATNGEKVKNGGALKGIMPGSGGAATGKQGNFITKFLKPWIYSDYATLRQMMPADDGGHNNSGYSEEVEAGAYFPPSVTSSVPILWIPEDPAGVSKQEVALTSKVIPITDEGCSLDEKNKIVWDTESARPPIWTEKIYY